MNRVDEADYMSVTQCNLKDCNEFYLIHSITKPTSYTAFHILYVTGVQFYLKILQSCLEHPKFLGDYNLHSRTSNFFFCRMSIKYHSQLKYAQHHTGIMKRLFVKASI